MGNSRRSNSKQFVPLADVPDLVWRTTRKLDSSNHFADMDQAGNGDFAGKTLLDVCQKPKNVSLEVWNKFYESLGVAPKDRGALPFRVWQIYKHMVQFVREGKLAEFICAGGVLSHYVADACEPLHVSFLHHGRPGFPAEERVHSIYETDMLDRFATELLAGVNASIDTRTARADFKGGFKAAVSVLGLMQTAIGKLPPLKIIEAFDQQSGKERLPYMWSVLKDDTAFCMAEGCLRMAAIWASAWKEGGGSKIKASALAEVSRDTLKALYYDKTFLPAYRLNDPALAADLL